MDPARQSPLHSWALGAGLAVAAALFWSLRVVGSGTEPDLSITDLFIYYLPSYEILYGALLDGRLPLWNPYPICGTPMLASLQAGFFYPGHLLYLLLPVGTAFAVSYVAHLTLIAVSMLLLVRRLGLGVGAAVAAGIFLALRGRYPAMVFFPNMLEASAWLPLGALAVERIARQPGLRSVAALALCTGLSLLAGYPQASVYTVYSWGALLAILLLLDRRGGGDWLRASACMGAGLLLGVALAGAQLLPAWELTGLGTRSAGALTRAEQFPMAWFGSGLPGIVRTLKAPFPVLLLSFGWVATAALVSAFFARHARALGIASFAMAVVVLLFAMGPATPVFDWLSTLPALGWFRFPRRSLFMLDFFAAVTVAVGVHAWLQGRWRERVEGAAGKAHPALLVALSGLPAVLLLAEIFSAKPNDASIRRALDSMSYYEQDGPVFERMATSGERAWIRSPNIYPPLPKIASYRRVRSVSDYEPLNQRRQSDYFTWLMEGTLLPKKRGQPYSGRLKHLSTPVYPGALNERAHLLDVAAAHWIVLQKTSLTVPDIARFVRDWGLVEQPEEDAHLVLFRNPHAVPRAYSVYDVQPAPEAEELMRTMADPAFDPLASSFVEGMPALPPRPQALPEEALRGAPARIVVDQDTRVEVEVEMSREGVLVLADSIYPGWHASVDGRPLEIFATNHLFRGVRLPAGHHRVVFAYRPWSVPVGAAASAFAGLLIAVLWVRGRRADELPMRGASDSIGAPGPAEAGASARVQERVRERMRGEDPHER
jgi:hypothetical protein